MVRVLPVGKFALINLISLGDGIESYYIISPAGYLVKTTIDPVDFNSVLLSKHRSKSNIIIDFIKPLTQTHLNGKQVFTAILSGRDCIACKTTLCAKVNFKFSKPGKPLSIQAEESNDSCIR